MKKCPVCGQPWPDQKGHAPDAAPRGLMESAQPGPRFRNEAMSLPAQPGPLPLAGLNISREMPAFMPTIEANVSVPLRQSIISGCLTAPAAGLAVGGGGYLLGFSLSGSIWTGVIVAGITTSIVAGSQWFSRAEYFNNLLLRLETVTGADVNRDGDIGRPEPDSTKVQVEDEKGKLKAQEEFPVRLAVLVKFARAVSSSNPKDTFSERTAIEYGMTQEQFRAIRDKFLNHHWARWKHPTRRQQGIELRQSGLEILKALARGDVPAGLADDNQDDTRMSGQYIEKGAHRESWA